MPKVYGYARASTEEQVVTLKNQEDVIEREYKHRFSDMEWAGTVVESGVSGNIPISQRPKGLSLCANVEAGDVVIVTKLDRGFRNLADLVNTLRLWRKKDVRLVLLDLGVDTGTPVGAMLVHILGAVAQFERERMGERMRECYRKCRAMGKIYHAPYGFKLIGKKGEKQLLPDPYTRAIARKFIEWIEEGWTDEAIYFHCLQKKIKTRLQKEWTRSTIQNTIKRERQLQATEKAEAEKTASKGV